MAKSISAALQSDIQRNVTTLATCITIERKDGKFYRLTTHDSDVVFEGNTYRHDVPFLISAIDSGSQFSIDNTQLTLFCDGTVFVKEEFDRGLFDYANATIFFVDYETPSHGKMTMRAGWFGPVERNPNNVVVITITGLLKILDFEVGRVYQPTCDADFGDARCKVAVQQNQHYSALNPQHTGQWVYKYDEALMTAITLVNPGFEADGVRTENQTITGWTKGPGTAVFVNGPNTSPIFGTLQPVTKYEGTYALWGSDDATDDSSGFENYVYQDINLVAGGVSAADIDDGKITIGYFVKLMQAAYLLDPVRLRIEMFDTNDILLSVKDTNWMYFDDFNQWRERSIVWPVYPDVRKVRLYIYMKKEDGIYSNTGADDVKLFWWDHTGGNPYEDSVHRVARIVDFTDDASWRPNNPSFEPQGILANALSLGITGWTTTGSWWKVDNDLGILTPQHNSYFLIGGNDGSGIQKTYTITQTTALSTIAGISPTRQLLSKIVGAFYVLVGFGDTSSKATAKLEWLDAGASVLETHYAINDQAAVGVLWISQNVNFTVPALATQLKITLQAKSPIGSSDAKIAFDNLRFYFYDAERPAKNDSLTAQGLTGTVFDPTVGSYTADGNLIWKAMPAHLQYDVVSSVVSRKAFIGTAIAGAEGTYETGEVWWISGANAGFRNVIRTWTPGTKQLKMYFKEPFDISSGDRFIYIRSCQRRFTEDCLQIFQNVINFRGFPHLPGKLETA